MKKHELRVRLDSGDHQLLKECGMTKKEIYKGCNHYIITISNHNNRR